MRRMGWVLAPRGRAIHGSKEPHSVARTRPGDERAAAVVELALLLPVMTSLVLGVASGGMAYNRKVSITNAVREGSRLGSTRIPASVTPPTTWVGAVVDHTVGVSAGDVDGAQVCVRLVREAGATDDNVLTSSCPASMTADEPATPANLATGDCVVKVWAQRADRLQVVFFSTDLTLKAKSVSRYEGATC